MRDWEQMTEWEKQYERSIPVFVDEMTKLSMEEVKLPKDRDRFIQEEIRDKAWISKREGFPEYTEEFFNNAIVERRNQIIEEQKETVLNENPLLEKRQIRKDGGLLDTDSKRMQYNTGTPPTTTPTPPIQNKYTAQQAWKDFSGKVVEGYAAPYAMPASLLAGVTRDVPGVNKMTGALADGVGALSDSVKAIFDPKSWQIDRSKPKTRDMMLPSFTQDRQAIFDENVQAMEEESSRKYMNEGGEMEDQMGALMKAEETHTMPDGTVMPGATHEEYEEQTMLPDDEMEEDYVEYVFDSTLNPQDKEYLENALAEDAKLSEIIDQVVESTTEFSGSGTVEGPGSEKSDSIPARLSAGEFVFTAKATEEIGADSLQRMMQDAEAAADERQSVAYGGYMTEMEDETAPIQTSGLREARRNVPQVAQTKRQVEEEMLKSSPRRFYQPISG